MDLGESQQRASCTSPVEASNVGPAVPCFVHQASETCQNEHAREETDFNSQVPAESFNCGWVRVAFTAVILHTLTCMLNFTTVSTAIDFSGTSNNSTVKQMHKCLRDQGPN